MLKSKAQREVVLLVAGEFFDPAIQRALGRFPACIVTTPETKPHFAFYRGKRAGYFAQAFERLGLVVQPIDPAVFDVLEEIPSPVGESSIRIIKGSTPIEVSLNDAARAVGFGARTFRKHVFGDRKQFLRQSTNRVGKQQTVVNGPYLAQRISSEKLGSTLTEAERQAWVEFLNSSQDC